MRWIMGLAVIKHFVFTVSHDRNPTALLYLSYICCMRLCGRPQVPKGKVAEGALQFWTLLQHLHSSKNVYDEIEALLHSKSVCNWPQRQTTLLFSPCKQAVQQVRQKHHMEQQAQNKCLCYVYVNKSLNSVFLPEIWWVLGVLMTGFTTEAELRVSFRAV